MLKIKWFRGQWLHITFARVALYVIMIALVCFTALPLVYLVSTAFKPLDELFVYPPQFFVRNPTTKNFTDLVVSLGTSTVPFTRYAFNSIVITIIIVMCTIAVSCMGAYSLVKLQPPGGKLLFNLILVALMFSPHVTKIPSYMVVNGLGLINTYGALILPNIAVAYNIFLIKQFMEQFPDELLEASRIDGATEMRTFIEMVLPALKPSVATLTVFSFTANWNDYFSPLIYVTSQAMKTLPLALQTIGGGAAGMSIGRAGAVAASTFLTTAPTIIIFVWKQGQVMETMTHSGIKG